MKVAWRRVGRAYIYGRHSYTLIRTGTGHHQRECYRRIHPVLVMKARFDAGTDVAMIGAWDAQRGAQPFTAEEFKRLSDTLDAEADAGHIFVLHTRADGGGHVDVYVDEPIPSEVVTRLTAQGDEFVLTLPSGALMVDGVERYRARKPDAMASDRAVRIPAGDYALRCYAAEDDENAVPRSERDLATILGKDDLQY